MPVRELRETLVYFKDDLLQQLRSVKALLLLVSYLLFNLVMTLPYLGISKLITEQLLGQSPQTAVALHMGQATLWAQAFAKLTGSVEEGAAMAAIPLPALYTFTLAAFFVPVLVVLTTSDIVADALRTGHIRYLTLRSSRASMLWGRLASRISLLAVTVLVATQGCFLLFWWKLEGLPPESLGHFVRFGLLLAATVPTYAGLAALCSSLVKSSFFALLLGIFLLLVFGVTDLASDIVGVVTPNHYKLLLYSPTRWWIGVLAYGGFAALFSGLAYLRLRTRDV